MANAPVFVNKGTFGTGTGTVSPSIPAGVINDDIMILIVESANQAVAAPSGWTQIPFNNNGTGTAATAGAVQLNVFYKIVGGLEAAPTVPDSGDHTNAIIAAFRNVDPVQPFNVPAVGRVDTSATASMTWSSVTTTKDNCLIVLATALDQDIAGTAQVGTVTNSNLTGITEVHDQTVIAGAGGGVHMAYGLMPTAGAVGTSTATGAAATTHSYLTIALQASEPTVRAVGQYKNDMSTVVPVGGATGTDGISNNVYLQTEYESGALGTATTPKAEVKAIGTNFNGTATSTLRSIVQSDQTNPKRALRGSTMIYDDVNQRLVAFGGYSGSARYNEVWHKYIDRPGQPWRLLTVSGTPPAGRNLHGMTFVKGNLTSGGALRAYAVIWGGFTTADQNDMYTLRLDTPGSEAWATVTQTAAPTAREYMNGTLISTPVSGASDQNYIYMFGGWATVRENQLLRCTFDVDTPTAVTWTTLKTNGAAGSPPARTGFVSGYKASTNKIYIYGGYNGTTMLSDFWEYDIAGNSWAQRTVTGTAPTASETAAGGYDATNNRFWFAGGWTTNGTFTTGINQVGYISNVGSSEAYNVVRAHANHPGNQAFPGNSFAAYTVVPDKGWLAIRNMAVNDPTTDMERYEYIIDFAETATSEFPVYGGNEGEYLTARDAPTSVWDPVAKEWLMIGGFDDMYDDTTIANGTHSNDVWAYNPTTNSWRYANAGFKGLPACEGRIAVYDTTRNRIVLFGGLTGIEMTNNEVWTLTRDGNGNYAAAKLAPTGSKPTQRWLGAAVYDDANDRMIIALGGNQAGPVNDVWSLSFTGSAQGAWTQLTPTGSVTGVVGLAYAVKPSLKRLYIFGGATNSALSTVSSQTCFLDYSTTNCAWTVVTTTGAVARRTPAMDYDADMDRLLVFGGFNGTASIATMSVLPLATTTWDTVAPTTVPDARRSTIGKVIDGKFYVSHGRSDSAMWYRNTWALLPNYITPNSSIWYPMFPAAFTPTYHSSTGLTTSTGYHWQAWTTEGSVDSAKVSYG